MYRISHKIRKMLDVVLPLPGFTGDPDSCIRISYRDADAVAFFACHGLIITNDGNAVNNRYFLA